MPDYEFGVWITHGGGLARQNGSNFVFIDPPKCTDFAVGDSVPQEWDLVPQNSIAHRVSMRTSPSVGTDLSMI
jgi:hypothetical protein